MKVKFLITKHTVSQGDTDKRFYHLLGEEQPRGLLEENFRPILFSDTNAEKVCREAIRLGATPDNCSWDGHKSGSPLNKVSNIDRFFSKHFDKEGIENV